ncbi:Voltage-dependent calcium channel subunit alpha-2/delta-3, partial [Stegodyphus mimosarum]
MPVKIPIDDFRRVVTRVNSYYYGPINATPFSLGVSLPEPYGRYRVVGQVEVKRKGEDWLQYFRGNNWRVHPDWIYCENSQKEDNDYTTPEENIKKFLSESLSTQNFRWSTTSTRPPIFDKPICEKDLIQSLVFDAKATLVDHEKCQKESGVKNYEDKFGKMFGITHTFVATRSGFMRFNEHRQENEKYNGTDKPVFQLHTRATEEEFYKRAVDFYNINSSAFVYSVPHDAGSRKNSVVTGSRAIFLGTGKKKAPAAVVGLQFQHSIFADSFLNTTSKCMQTCTYKCK